MSYFAASLDNPETNRRFATSLELDFPILSDPEKKVARAYGVLRAFGLYAARQTFFIGKDGKIIHIERKVRPRDAGGRIAGKLAELGVELKGT